MLFLAIIMFGLSFLVLFFNGFLLGRKSSIQICIINGLIAYSIIWLYLFQILSNNNTYLLSLGTFLNLDLLVVIWSLYVDCYTLIMALVVTTISLLVLLYSIEYMSKDPNKIRFFAYLNLFTFFMLVFITAGNLIQMFLGWEGIGICSYLLIIFWDTRISAKKSAIKAVLVNKIGDLSFIFTICILFLVTTSLNIVVINFFALFSIPDFIQLALNSTKGINLISVLAVALLIAVIGKSAQVGLHIWLPDAMEGPTPVSALLHAATMVTAGIFLSLRFSVILELSTIYYWYALFGGVTALYAAILGFCQEDLKKSIAYSTCSQLGYMVLICSLAGYNLAFFHLFNHAFFKALLFLTAGCIIHSSLDEQDMRILGGFSLRAPILFISMFIGGSSLLALPFLSGFYSKELIINLGFMFASFDSTWCFFFCITAAIFTVLYTCINTFDLFFDDLYYRSVLRAFHPTSSLMVFILTVLIVCSFWSGFIFSELFLGLGTEGVVNFQPTALITLLDLETLGFYNKYFPTIFSLTVVVISFGTQDRVFVKLAQYSFKYLSLDDLYFKVISLAGWRKAAYWVFIIDRGFLEIFGPQGLYKCFNYTATHLTTYLGFSLINYLALVASCVWVILIVSLAI